MAKKITAISTSIRPNSNSELLAKSFAEGAEAAGNEVAFILVAVLIPALEGMIIELIH